MRHPLHPLYGKGRRRPRRGRGRCTRAAQRACASSICASGMRTAYGALVPGTVLDEQLRASLQAELLVIGGGATGAGVACHAALRCFDVVLVDRADLAEGTSGRFHGLLDSWGAATSSRTLWLVEECVAEIRILRPGDPGLHRGHRRALRHDARRRSRLRRSVLAGCRACDLPAGGDRRRGSAARRAALATRHPARVRRTGRVDRCVEDRLVVRAWRIWRKGRRNLA